VGAVHEQQFVGYHNLAEYAEHIDHAKLWQLHERLELDVTEHLGSIRCERRHERQLLGHQHATQHLEQPEL
jgi:hypothetical protein